MTKQKTCALCDSLSDWLIMARLKYYGENGVTNIELHWVCPTCLVDRLKKANIITEPVKWD